MSDNIGLRPQSFDEIVGQRAAKEILSLRVDAFHKTGIPSGHILLTGSAGTGKSTISRIFANEVSANFYSIMGTRINKWEDLVYIFKQIKPNDVIFIDEIHALKSKIQEELYGVLEDFEYDDIKWNYGIKKKVKTQVPRFTLIGATTHAGLLNAPFRRRFQLVVQLENYTKEDLSILIKRAAERVYKLNSLPNDIVGRLAGLSKNNASNAVNLLRNLMELAETTTLYAVVSADLTINLLNRLLQLQGLDPLLGLDRVSRQYLTLLAGEIRPMGSMAISNLLNEQEETIRNMIEPFLLSDSADVRVKINDEVIDIHGSLVRMTRSGRQITESGAQFVKACAMLQTNNWFPGEKFGNIEDERLRDLVG